MSKDRHHPASSVAQRGLVAVGIAALLGACASDPYADSVHKRPGEIEAEIEKGEGSAAAKALVRVARATRAAGDPYSAINVYKRANRADPYDQEVLIELGETLASVGALEDAREALVKAVDKTPSDPKQRAAKDARAARGLGNVLVGLYEPAMAVTRFEQANTIYPEPASYNGLGVAYDQLGNVEAAEAAYRKGLELDHDNVALTSNLALSLALRGKFEDGVDLLAALMRKGVASRRVRHNLALIYGLGGRQRDAVTLLAMDMDAAAVSSNVAYYEMLAALDPETRRRTVLGVRKIVPRGATPAATPVQAK